MNFIYRYTDEEFMLKVNDKLGNIRLFKKHLRKLGLIGNRQQLSKEHIELFESIRNYKLNHHTTWDLAFKKGLDSSKGIKNNTDIPLRSVISESFHNNNEAILLEILKTLKNIEAKL